MYSSNSCASSSAATAKHETQEHETGEILEMHETEHAKNQGLDDFVRFVCFVHFVVVVGAAGFATPARAQSRPFTLDDIAAFKSITDVALSPDGRRAVFAVRSTILSENRTQTDLWIVPTDGSAPARQLTFDRAAEGSLSFSPDGNRLAFLADRDGSRQVWALPATGGEAVKLTSHPMAVSAFDFSPDGTRLAIVAQPAKTDEEQRRERDKDDGYLLGEQWRNNRVWLVQSAVREAQSAELTDGRMHVRALAWSPDGRSIAIGVAPNAEADASEDAKAQIVDVASRQVQDVPGGDLASSFAWSPDAKRLAFARAFDGHGISREDVHVWEVGTREPARNVSAALDRDVEDLFWTPDGTAIDARIAHGATHSIARLQLTGGATPAVERFSHSIGVVRRAGTTQVYTRTDRPAEIFVGARERDARAVTSINAAAAQVQLPSVEAIRWKGPIGEVEGILFKPSGYDTKQRYPLLVNPHGGPRGHSSLDFDPAAAYWTSLGYVVLKPNFRGSTGYGDKFTKANVEDWGEGPFQDVMSGVDALIAQGVADADRLFMFGWSYGGIMANWTATHTTRFKAIVSGASVADARLQYSISDSRRWRFDYFRGSPFLDANYPLYQRESAVTHAKHAKTPTLFVVGAEDKRCPIEQSLMMYRAFKDHGVTTDLLIYPREDHGFVEPRHIVDRAKRVAEWIKRFDSKQRSTTTSSGS
jgi:dipeptidyl aminopeptidase/acylaminoacyl peptidase